MFYELIKIKLKKSFLISEPNLSHLFIVIVPLLLHLRLLLLEPDDDRLDVKRDDCGRKTMMKVEC
jgi:hypothetical protein